jgi:hypothetical protein
MKLFQFGEQVTGYEIPVLNEREVRAAAGLFFVVMLIAIQRIIYTWDFQLLKYASLFFFFDFATRVLVNPRYAPSLVLGRWVVNNQTPEYVGAAQKKFAWIIGLALGAFMFVTLNVLNLHSPVTGIICMVCLLFLFFEAAFGICLGCKVYPWIYRKQARYCPGEVCARQDRQPIQKTTLGQWAALLLFVLLFVGALLPLKGNLAQSPTLIWGMERPPATGAPTATELPAPR